MLALVPEEAAGPLRLDATLRVTGDGGYALQASADSDDPEVRLALLAAGFQQAPGGYSRVEQGRFGG